MAATIAGAGTAIFRINGVSRSARGNVTIMPLTQNATAGVNLDGSLYFTVKNVPSNHSSSKNVFFFPLSLSQKKLPNPIYSAG